MEQRIGSRASPDLKALVREASKALAGLDADRLEELALRCLALNRDFAFAEKAARAHLAEEAQKSMQDMAVFARVLDATRANVEVLRRLSELREGEWEYGPAPGHFWTRTEIDHGND